MPPYEPLPHHRQKLERTVTTEAEAVFRSLMTGDYAGFVARCDPVVVAMFGGADRAGEVMRSHVADMQADQVVFTGIDVDPRPEFYRFGDELQALVRFTGHLAAPGHRIEMRSYTIALSEDEGSTWLFVGGASTDKRELRRFFPNLSPELEFPADEAPVVTDVPLH